MRLPTWLTLIPFLMVMAGCASSRDVSNDARFHRGFLPGQVYRLTLAAALFPPIDDSSDFLLDAPAADSRESDVKGIARGTVPTGSRLRIVPLTHVTIAAPVQGESYVYASAMLLDGPWARSVVRIGSGLCRSNVIQAPDGTPTVIGLPDNGHLAYERNAAFLLNVGSGGR